MDVGPGGVGECSGTASLKEPRLGRPGRATGAPKCARQGEKARWGGRGGMPEPASGKQTRTPAPNSRTGHNFSMSSAAKDSPATPRANAAPHHSTPSHTIPHRPTPFHTVPHRPTPSHTVPHRSTPFHTIPHRSTPFHTVLQLPYASPSHLHTHPPRPTTTPPPHTQAPHIRIHNSVEPLHIPQTHTGPTHTQAPHTHTQAPNTHRPHTHTHTGAHPAPMYGPTHSPSSPNSPNTGGASEAAPACALSCPLPEGGGPCGGPGGAADGSSPTEVAGLANREAPEGGTSPSASSPPASPAAASPATGGRAEVGEGGCVGAGSSASAAAPLGVSAAEGDITTTGDTRQAGWRVSGKGGVRRHRARGCAHQPCLRHRKGARGHP